MVFLDYGIKDRSKIPVGIPVTSIYTTVLVVKLNCTGNCLSKSEPRGLGSYSGEFIPSLLGHMLGNKRVLGLDVWE